MLVKLTLPDGTEIWFNMAQVGYVKDYLVHMSDGADVVIQETSKEFWDRMQGRGGVAVPTGRIVSA